MITPAINPHTQLICLGLAHLDEVPCLTTRAALLREAAAHLPDKIADECRVTAACIEAAERAQLELRGLLFSA